MSIEGPSLTLLAPHTRFEPTEVHNAEAGIGVEAGNEVSGGGGVAVFEDMLKNLAVSANDRINAAQRASEAFSAGTVDDIHGTMLSISKADIELRMIGNVKNKIVDAFYELWRMQI